MNRSIILVGVGILLIGFALMSFPIAVTGQEQFDIEQEAGLYFLPPAMAVLLIGSISDDPRLTTVGGTFGNPDVAAFTPSGKGTPARPRIELTYHPKEPVACRYCSTIMAPDLVQCPRCARARECRSCGRLLGVVLERATCPACARPEPFCNCPHLPPRPTVSSAAGRRV
jgi:RNA polymerase subunit RPABC4/transcription elongation factor Spt4